MPLKYFITLLALLGALLPGRAACPPERIYLSGIDLDHPARWGFYCTDGMRSQQHDSINVPCSWELQGFGDYTYGRWYKVKGMKPSTESGIYTLDFTLPEQARGRCVKIVFDGVMTDCTVKVNDSIAGPIHQGGFYRFSRDITRFIRPGETNRLEIRVDKHSANKSINAAERKADWWLFGGIYRPVWLEILPQGHIRHVVHNAHHDGCLQSAVELEGDATGCRVALTVADTDGKIVSNKVSNPIAKEEESLMIPAKIENIRPWTTETPYLYTATVSLLSSGGDTLQRFSRRLGFRTVEFFPQDGLYLNGKKIILKGVNRHSFNVDGGRATSIADSRRDALLIKEMNMNAVRSHYPPDEHFLDACDSLGILYMDELAGWQNGYDSEVGPGLVREMIERDVNHPCIVIWSNGNEGGWNTALDSLFARHDYLQKRHLVHPWADFNDLDTHHYPAYLTGVARFTNGYSVFMPTEFMHSMYDQGGGAGLRNFWDRWKTNPMFAGGFIWAFCDEAPRRTDRKGTLDSDGSNAPDGILGPRREREGSFYAIREQWCPLQVTPFIITPRFDGRIAITNESDFADLGDYTMSYEVVVNPSPAESSDVEPQVVATGNVALPAAAPGERVYGRMEDPEAVTRGDILRLTARNRDGRQIGEWNIPTRFVADYYTRHVDPSLSATTSKKAHTAITSRDSLLTLSSPTVSVTFNRRTGRLVDIRAGKRDVPFNNGPIAVGMKMRYEPTLSTVRKDGEDVVYCARYKGGVDSIVWRLTPQGILSMDALLLNRAGGGGGFDDAFMDSEVYNLGLSFSYPDSLCTGMTWLGRGPSRVWKNRVAGARIDTWSKAYNNTVTGESYDSLIYPEFKGYHGNIYWARLESEVAPVTFYSRNDGLYYHIFTPAEPAAAESPTMPAFPAEGNLSFLLDIPAIRSFKPIEQQGPDSQPGNIRIKKGDRGLSINITFDFK